MKREAIPLRFSFQARKLAPSVFHTDPGESAVRYEVLPDGEGWLYFAYHPHEVIEALRKQGIDPQRIRRLYFAQQLADDLETPVRLEGGKEALVRLDGTVTLLPLSLLPTPVERPADTLPRPSRFFRLPIHSETGFLGKKTIQVLLLAALLLSLSWLVEGIRYARAAQAAASRLNEALAAHPTLQSRLTRENIYAKYHRIDRTQRQFRETVRAIGSLVSKESKLDSLTLDPQGYRATLSVHPKKLQTLETLAQDQGLGVASASGTTLKLKGAW
jgi:hypothetical protein